MDTQTEAVLSARQREILAITKERGFATIEALAAHFAVSAQTVRREIIRLDEAGLLQRFHGGAGVRDATIRLGYAQKQTVAPHAKERIGGAVAALIPAGASVFLDVGTTVEAVARALCGTPRLHVFTHSLHVANILAGQAGIRVFVPGGMVGGADGALVGDGVTAGVARFKADYAVIGLSGYDDDGAPMDFDPQKVAVKQAFLANARMGIAAADASKFARRAFVRVAPPSGFAALVTDASPPAGLGDMFAGQGLTIVIA